MKHFIAKVNEIINGFESTNTILIVAKNEQSAEKKLNNFMKIWRGDYSNKDESGYWFDGNGICVNGSIYKEIPFAEYLVLKQYI
jgi:hypothetical protein